MKVSQMNRNILYLSILISLFLDGVLLMSEPAQSQTDSTAKAITDQMLKKISPKDAEELIKKNADNSNFVILDVRTPKEFAEEHIKDAIIVDFRSTTFENDLDKFDRNKTYIVYCRVGNRSGKATELMKQKGFKKIYDLEGGIFRWKKDGLPVQK